MKMVSLDAPRKPYPMTIPTNALRLNYHITTTVITLGGSRETTYAMAHAAAIADGSGKWVTIVLGCPKSTRGITSVIKDGKPYLKLAGLQIIEERLPYDDIETYMPCYRVSNWAITTWSNTIMVHSDSSDNRQEDFTVWAPDIIISDTVRSELLASGLLHRLKMVKRRWSLRCKILWCLSPHQAMVKKMSFI
uniref:Uncharacterized protein n=1 Tax=Oryza brachyantha TaxID=4533 RepID=J3KVF3_ORYBR